MVGGVSCLQLEGQLWSRNVCFVIMCDRVMRLIFIPELFLVTSLGIPDRLRPQNRDCFFFLCNSPPHIYKSLFIYIYIFIYLFFICIFIYSFKFIRLYVILAFFLVGRPSSVSGA